jgi:type I restriction enzyme S subunit
MQKYPAYKDSGVEWLGEIPSHWEVKKVTHVFNKIGSGTTPTAGALKYYDNGQINWLQTGDLNDGLIDDTNKKITKKAITDFSTLKQYPKESIVLAMYGATIGKLGYLNIETTTNQACCVLGNPNTFSSKYGFYSFMNAKTSIISMSYGGGQPNISQDLVKSLRLSVPPLPEQTAIAAFLDRKTTLIDQAIAIKKKQIELLKERRQILIHKAVTRGLNPNVKLKDSGVEWIGEIPEHWVVKKLTFVTSFITCGVASTPTYVDSEIGKPFLSAQNVRPFKMSYEKFNHIPIRLYKELTSIRKIVKGDLLMTRVGAGIGDVAIFNEDIDCAVYVSLTHIRVLNEVFNKYIMYFLGSYSAKLMHEEGTVHAGGQGNLNVNNLRKYRLPLPKIDEQKQIVEYIETSTTKIATAITLKEQEIEKLKEYKATLINSAVTGKIKVC